MSSSTIVWFDRLSLIGVAAGILLMVQPVWDGGLQWGFFFTILITVLQIIVSHLLPDADEEQAGEGGER